MDPREVRTKAALAAALRTLIGQNPLATIDVSELCRQAGIHRTTFYGHYSSIDELAVDVFAAEIDEAAAIDYSPLADAETMIGELHVATVRLLEIVKRDIDGFRALFQSPVSLGFRRTLLEYLHQRVRLAMDGFAERGVAIENRGVIASAFVAGGLVGAIEAFSLSEDLDVDAAAAQIIQSMPGWWPSI